MSLFDFVTIDFETANSRMSSACSVGIIAVKDLEVVEKFSALINPNAEFNEKNIEIHSITPEMVEGAKTLNELMPEIEHYFNRHVPVIAHNAHFDMSTLRESTDAAIPEFFYADSMYIAEPFVSGSKSLVNCAAALGVDVAHHHDAADDALVCAQICIEAFKRSGCVTAWEFFALNGTALYNFSELKPMQIFGHGGKGKAKKQNFYRSKNLSSLAPAVEIDASNPLFGKSIVFTGDLSIERSEAAQLAVNCGALVKSSVSSKTDYLVVGVQDKALVGDDGLSTKEEKAYQLNEEGKGHICFLSEEQFLALVKSEVFV